MDIIKKIRGKNAILTFTDKLMNGCAPLTANITTVIIMEVGEQESRIRIKEKWRGGTTSTSSKS